MKKLPYFPFYYLDWLSSSSVIMMSHAERGLFIDMLSRCYNDDGLPDDNSKLQRLFNCSEDLLIPVKDMFYSVDGLLKNEKLDSIIKDQQSMIKDKSKAGKASAKARAKKKLQKSTGVQQVLNSVPTEHQQNSTNKTEQNRTEQNKDIKPKEKDSQFDIFWSDYPRKTGKGAARTSFAKAIKKATPDEIISGLLKHEIQAKTDVQFIPHPATWLNQERWTDEASKVAETTIGKGDSWT